MKLYLKTEINKYKVNLCLSVSLYVELKLMNPWTDLPQILIGEFTEKLECSLKLLCLVC